MGEKKLTPLKRFSNFTDNWKPISIKEIGDSYRGGGTPKTTKEDYWNGDIPWIQSSDLNEGDFFLGAARKQITELGLMNSATKLIKKNSLAIVTRVGVGKLSLIPFEYTTSQDFLSISDLNIDKHFAIYVLFKKLQEESKSLQGTSIKGITSGELLSKEVIIPSNSLEQQKIGAFFKVLDERIANQERKIAKVKDLKSAYLTEMFPQEGETIPKRRFKGFKGKWHKKTLGDFGTVEMNKRIFKEQTSIIGDVPFYKIGTFGKQADAFISYELFNEYKTKYPYPNPGDILISAAGSIGRTVAYQGENAYYQDSNIVWLKHDGKLSNLFLKQFYKFTNWSSLEGSTIKRLYNRDILEAIIHIPSSIKEQQKIGEFFKNLDNQIETEEKKLDKLQKMKEAYLEEMFV